MHRAKYKALLQNSSTNRLALKRVPASFISLENYIGCKLILLFVCLKKMTAMMDWCMFTYLTP